MGPGRQVKTFQNVTFQRKVELQDIHNTCGDLNTAQVTQEMDDFFALYKAKTDAKTQDIFCDKLLSMPMNCVLDMRQLVAERPLPRPLIREVSCYLTIYFYYFITLLCHFIF